MRPAKTLPFLAFCLLLIAALPALIVPAAAQQQEKRVALVIGNGAYATAPLATTANDAGLIAQTLQAAGFDVIGARDLDADSLRKTFRDFMQKIQASPSDTVAMVYLSGYGIQLAGENYFIPVDSTVNRDTDVPIEGLRVSDYLRELASVPLKASIFVLDAARQQPFIEGGKQIAGGLALVDPSPNSLVAFNAAPGTVAPIEPGPYGAYAQALAEMIRTGGLSLPDVFDRVRLRVSETTKGAQIPWDAHKLQVQFTFFERAPDAPAVQGSADQVAAIRERPMRDLGAQEAFTAALARDTMQGYQDFLAAYPGDPLARRVRAILAVRREAITWRRTYLADTPDAYWSYLRRYPRGPHAWDARRRLAILSAALEPPRSFTMIDYDLPPPPPDEVVFVDRPVFYFGDPEFDFAPPPPPPVFFLAPPPADFVVLDPPYAPVGLFILPQPVFVPILVFCQPPVYVAPPPNNIIFNNIHNTIVINNTINVAPKPPALGNIAAAAANGQTGSPSLATKAAAISKDPSLMPKHEFIDTKAKTATPRIMPANATATTPVPQQGTTPQGAKQQGTLTPGHVLPGSPSGTALPAPPGKGIEASKGAASGTKAGPGGLTPSTKLSTSPSTTTPSGTPGGAATPGNRLTTAPAETAKPNLRDGKLAPSTSGKPTATQTAPALQERGKSLHEHEKMGPPGRSTTTLAKPDIKPASPPPARLEIKRAAPPPPPRLAAPPPPPRPPVAAFRPPPPPPPRPPPPPPPRPAAAKRCAPNQPRC